MNDHHHHHNHHQRSIHPHQSRNSNNNNRVDMLADSESPEIQEFRLYRELSREIERDPSHRVRYMDSELYLRTQDRHPSAAPSSSEIQSATVNIGQQQLSATSSASSIVNNKVASSSTPKSAESPLPDNNHHHHHHHMNHQPEASGSKYDGEDIANHPGGSPSELDASKRAPVFIDGNCQVCLIKEVRDNLTHVTRVIQERNEQLSSKLKARRLRTFFERQMLD